jgi:hypothetical protein
MKSKKNSDELTKKMHGEFTVSNDVDLKHAAWSALSAIKNGFITQAQAMTNYGVSTKDLEAYRDEWENLIKK